MAISEKQAEQRSLRQKERAEARQQSRAPRKEGQPRKDRVRTAPEGVLPELWINPRPLISKSLGIAVVWSPKSGCSFVSKWFFQQLGIELDGWIHLQRRPFQSSPESVESAIAFSNDNKTFRKMRVARNPYDRAVSSYLHYLALSGRNSSMQRDREIVFHNRDSLSFREFITDLLATDVDLVNVHWRPQTQPAEKAGYFDDATIIQLEQSMTEIPKFEKAAGLETVDLSALRSSHHDSSSDEKLEEFVGDSSFSGDVRKQSPDYELFYDRALLDAVEELYHEDFERFGYPTR